VGVAHQSWPSSETYRGYPTIRGNFERFYKEFPDRYHRFALSTDATVEEMQRLFGFDGTRVLDVASGTGRSTFAIAKHAASVVGVEPWTEMRAEAIRRQRLLGVTNVEFVEGSTVDLPAFAPRSFDRAVSVYGAPFYYYGSPEEDRRQTELLLARFEALLRPGGVIAFGCTSPGWRRIESQEEGFAFETGRLDPNDDFDRELPRLGFAHRDALVEQEFGSLDEALATYGFIYGERAIDYLLDRNTHRIPIALRVYWRRV
jgi:SAM-dependent methyltransferase